MRFERRDGHQGDGDERRAPLFGTRRSGAMAATAGRVVEQDEVAPDRALIHPAARRCVDGVEIDVGRQPGEGRRDRLASAGKAAITRPSALNR